MPTSESAGERAHFVSAADRRVIRLKRWPPERFFYRTVGEMFGASSPGRDRDRPNP